MISFLHSEELNEVLKERKRPVLIACLDRGGGFRAQKEVLEKIRGAFAETLSVYLLDADRIDFANNPFGIRGTPTYILIRKGGRREKIMGRIDQERITAFVYGAAMADPVEMT